MAFSMKGLKPMDYGNMMLLAVIVFIQFPFLLYSWSRIHAEWNKIYFVKRHRYLIVLILAAINIMVMIYIPTSATESIFFRLPVYTVRYGLVSVFLPSLYLAVLISSLRIWLLYFEIHMTKIKLQQVWRTAINPNDTSKNWFKSHQSTLGNPHYLLKFGVIAVILFSLLTASLRLLSTQDGLELLLTLDRVLGYSFVSLVLIGATVVWFKLRREFYDSLGIKKEMLYTIRLAAGYTLCASILLLAFYLNYINEAQYNLGWRGIIVVFCNFGVVILALLPRRLSKSVGTHGGTCGACYDFYECVTHKSGDGSGSNQPPAELKRPNIGSVSAGSTNSSVGSSHKLAGMGSLWTDIVATNYGFESLLDHLSREFSIENLLFISEYIQVKNILSARFRDVMLDIQKSNPGTRYDLDLPESYTFSDSKHKSSDGSSGKGVPMSLIAKDLNQKLSKLLNQKVTLANYHFKRKYKHSKAGSPALSRSRSVSNYAGTDFDLDADFTHTKLSRRMSKTATHTKKDEIDLTRARSATDLVGVVMGRRQSSVNTHNTQKTGKAGKTGKSQESDKTDKTDDKNDNTDSEIEATTDFTRDLTIEPSVTSDVDARTFAVCDAVIYSFEVLYQKYVGENSDFMINIKSRHYTLLRFILDPNQYKTWATKLAIEAASNPPDASGATAGASGTSTATAAAGANSNGASASGTGNNGNNGSDAAASVRGWEARNDAVAKIFIADVDSVVWEHMKFEAIVARNEMKNISKTTFMRAKLKAYIKMTPNLDRNELLYWLLMQLLESMENAVKEVSNVMHDSYSRFRRQSYAYDKAVRLATKRRSSIGPVGIMNVPQISPGVDGNDSNIEIVD